MWDEEDGYDDVRGGEGDHLERGTCFGLTRSPVFEEVARLDGDLSELRYSEGAHLRERRERERSQAGETLEEDDPRWFLPCEGL